jgi:hypothetical protein
VLAKNIQRRMQYWRARQLEVDRDEKVPLKNHHF